MIAAGYDNALSISKFTEADIPIIESFAEANLQDVLKESKIYANIKPFSFLPGHRKLLIALPNKLFGFKNNKCKKNLFSTPKQDAQASEQIEFVEILTDDYQNTLKEKLLVKLNLRAKSFGIATLFTLEKIISEITPYVSQSRSALNKFTYKCSVKCVNCEVTKPCTLVGHWQISNIETHLKKHSTQIENIDNDKEKNIHQSAHTKNPAKTQSVSIPTSVQNDKDLTAVLDSPP